MAKKIKKLTSIKRSQAEIFKIKNRKGYAVVCRNNLTEGSTVPQAIARMNKALKRIGCFLG